MSRDDLRNVPLWERLPSRPLESREIAAALPEPVSGDYVAAYAPVPDGVDLDFHGFETVVIESAKWHYLALTERDGTLEVNGEVLGPGDEIYDEVVAERWRREESVGPSPEFDTIEVALGAFENVSGLRAAIETAGAESKQMWELVAVNHEAEELGRECKRGTDGGQEQVSEELADELRRELYEERLKEAEETEAQRKAAQARAEGETYAAFTPDAELDPEHGAVERASKHLGARLDTVGDLPDPEDWADPPNGTLGYDGEQVLEYSGMAGWEPVNSASFLADETEAATSEGEVEYEAVGTLTALGEREQAEELLHEGANEHATVTDVAIEADHMGNAPTAYVEVVAPEHPNEVELKTAGSATVEIANHEVQRAVGSSEPQAHTTTVAFEGLVADVAHSVQMTVGEDETPDMLVEAASEAGPPSV